MARRRRNTRNGKQKPSPPGFVLDGSVTLAWYFKDEANAYAAAVAGRLPSTQAIVPSLWPLEVANVMGIGERRRRSSEAQATRFLSTLRSLPIAVDAETIVRAWQDTLYLARAHNLSVYNAAYLELAARCGLPLATLDDRLKAAAAVMGVAQFKP